MAHPLRLTLPLIATFALLAACTTHADAPPDAPPAAAPDTTSWTASEAPADQAGAAPAASTDEAAVPADAGAEQWLDRIEEQTLTIDTLTARVRYHRVQMLLGDEQTRFGRLFYDAGPPARFHVHFDRLQRHDELEMQDRRYIFDGRWLAEQHDDQRLFILRELVPEGEAERDLLRLGEGPFALPLDLRKDTVLERFTVEVVDEDEPTLEGTVLLRLTPRPDVEIDATRIDMWYDRQTLLPVQVRTVDETDQTETTIRLGDVQQGVEIEEAVFDVTPPAAPGWQVERRTLE